MKQVVAAVAVSVAVILPTTGGSGSSTGGGGGPRRPRHGENFTLGGPMCLLPGCEPGTRGGTLRWRALHRITVQYVVQY